jgi:hypothetical protein
MGDRRRERGVSKVKYPKTLAALRDQENRSWTVADALVDEIQTHASGHVQSGEFKRCADWLAGQGYEVKPDYLSQMRRTAIKFPTPELGTSSELVPSESVGNRRWNVPFRLYMQAASSPAWTPEFMDKAEAAKWSLREFSEKLTGKRWADDDKEAAKRVLRDKEKLAEVTQELEPDEAASAVEELGKRATPPKLRPVTEREISEAARRNPQGVESLGPPIGVAAHLAIIREQLQLIHEAAVNPRVSWDGVRQPVADSLQMVINQATSIREVVLNPDSARFSESEAEQLLKEG